MDRPAEVFVRARGLSKEYGSGAGSSARWTTSTWRSLAAKPWP